MKSLQVRPIPLPVILLALLLRAGMTEAKTGSQKLVWTDIRTHDVEGRGWSETRASFDRLRANPTSATGGAF